ncbi:hypothetical protein A6X21_02315 [Planctopirus hydrillae]|uniref:Uncharacterized protein n=1 Tax=Planctopirus hydrillae TaxID=1841610 RepID=A0A1C3ET91_9PLAN|nr:hypothetical protein A6X21_02315 [Planctopirus hydrillae]
MAWNSGKNASMCVNEYDTILDDQNQGFAAPFSVLASGRQNHRLAPDESRPFVKLADHVCEIAIRPI